MKLTLKAKAAEKSVSDFVLLNREADSHMLCPKLGSLLENQLRDSLPYRVYLDLSVDKRESDKVQWLVMLDADRLTYFICRNLYCVRISIFSIRYSRRRLFIVYCD